MPLQAQVLRNEPVSATVHKLALQAPPGWTFKAGQFVILPVPLDPGQPAPAKPLKGFYSLASAESALPEFELLVEHRDGGGPVSAWASRLKPGAQVALEGPLGHFGLAEDGERPRIFIGAGGGLAPLRSLLLSSLAQDAARAHHLLQGAPALLEAEWQALAQAHPSFRYQALAFLSPAAVLGALPRGLDPAPVFYLAGFGRDLDPLRQALLEAGVPAADIRQEKFG